ncbi:uncharacterized protein B0T15DRAFT_215993 [Chaetomium strumarium]|uniref:Cell surface protein n=1 Tax=Chaetomium strumarium TaxID=1170767 RepID=A0AAJ0GTT0_9PEZI|nr:hypothetical protein B0T15DRAFT_215993 [Chaetomium strumarium]
MYPNERGIRNPNAPAAAAGANPPHTYGQSAASGPAPTTAGHHRHDLLNKLDPRVDSTHDQQPVSQTGQNIPEGTYGPHRSRLANTLDPRVDSDLDSTRAGAGMGAGGGLGGGQPARMSGTHTAAGYGDRAGGGVAEGTYGPHATRTGNMLDPRVDSDRDRHVGRGAVGGGGVLGGSRAHHGGGVGGVGAPGAGMATSHTAGAGPHQSSLLNKLDPRVDSKTGTYKAGAGARGPAY